MEPKPLSDQDGLGVWLEHLIHTKFDHYLMKNELGDKDNESLNMQKLAEELLDDPELGCRSRVVSAFTGDGQSAGPPPEPEPDQPCFDFDYIIMSI